MTNPQTIRVFLGPDPDAGVSKAVAEAGGEMVEAITDADLVVWAGTDPKELQEQLTPNVRYVQLGEAGVEKYVESGVVNDGRVWGSGRGSHSRPVADHAVALILASLRRLGESVRAEHWNQDLKGRMLGDCQVLIVGAGGIGKEVIRLMQPFAPTIVAVSRRGEPVDGAARTITFDEIDAEWAQADVVLLSAPNTAETRHLVNGEVLAKMKDDAVLVNVGRGPLIDTDALVEALQAGRLSGVGLEVTDPEPLPDGHPLWTTDRVIITPHVSNPPKYGLAHLAKRAADNVRSLLDGNGMLAEIDTERGY